MNSEKNTLEAAALEIWLCIELDATVASRLSEIDLSGPPPMHLRDEPCAGIAIYRHQILGYRVIPKDHTLLAQLIYDTAYLEDLSSDLTCVKRVETLLNSAGLALDEVKYIDMCQAWVPLDGRKLYDYLLKYPQQLDIEKSTNLEMLGNSYLEIKEHFINIRNRADAKWHLDIEKPMPYPSSADAPHIFGLFCCWNSD